MESVFQHPWLTLQVEYNISSVGATSELRPICCRETDEYGRESEFKSSNQRYECLLAFPGYERHLGIPRLQKRERCRESEFPPTEEMQYIKREFDKSTFCIPSEYVFDILNWLGNRTYQCWLFLHFQIIPNWLNFHTVVCNNIGCGSNLYMGSSVFAKK